jgi:hypothetical protein
MLLGRRITTASTHGSFVQGCGSLIPFFSRHLGTIDDSAFARASSAAEIARPQVLSKKSRI